MSSVTHVLMPLSRKKVYEDQLKIKKSCKEFVRRQTKEENIPTGIKNYFFVQK